jgi:hypothetical protein
MENLYNFHDTTRPEPKLTTLVAHTDKRIRRVTQTSKFTKYAGTKNSKGASMSDMLVGLPKVLPLEGVCKGCVLGKYH